MTLETLHAVVDRLIPPDHYPGGWDAGVGDFLTLLFIREPELAAAHQAGMDALERESLAVYGREFPSLDAERQDGLLQNVEAGRVQTDWPVRPAQWFGQLREQVMEGFYADPGNGGNRDRVSWTMIGFEVRG
jgi:hypothetical protein